MRARPGAPEITQPRLEDTLSLSGFGSGASIVPGLTSVPIKKLRAAHKVYRGFRSVVKGCTGSMSVLQAPFLGVGTLRFALFGCRL